MSDSQVQALPHVTGRVNRFGARKPSTTSGPSPHELALLGAVTYASLFEFPLTVAEARRTLVRCPMTDDEVVRLYRTSAFLSARITFRHGLFFPAGRDAWVRGRADRETESRALIDRHRRVLSLLCAMPFIRMVAISGSLAHLNATGRADLDLFVVTKGRRVWLVTAIIVLLAKLAGVRRTLCANFVVADTALALDACVERDAFSANQMIHLRPITGEDCFAEFIAANPFAQELFPNFSLAESRTPLFAAPLWSARVKRAAEALLGWASAIGEVFCRCVYGAYLRQKAAGWPSPDQVRLEADHLKLHGNSHRRLIAARFDLAMAEARNQPAWLSSRCLAR